jgi:hypothetical protein
LRPIGFRDSLTDTRRTRRAKGPRAKAGKGGQRGQVRIFALVWSDDRRDYGERRERALVLLGTRLYFVAFTDRPEGRRVVSLRKANNREKIRYVRELSDDP